MTRHARSADVPRWTTLPALAALALLACSPSGEVDVGQLTRGDDDPGILFLTQDEVPPVQMEALFRGTVERDAAGCLRLRLPDGATVVWPKGFELVRRGDLLLVRDDGGDVVGRIGGGFRLSGGNVSTLHEGIPVSPEDRAAAEERCPGRYWLVGLEAEGIGG